MCFAKLGICSNTKIWKAPQLPKITYAVNEIFAFGDQRGCIPDQAWLHHIAGSINPLQQHETLGAH